jgi:3-hydroxyisobutyrate dehydrogenase
LPVTETTLSMPGDPLSLQRKIMQIAWIGLGNMGGPMAVNLVLAGHVVRGVDLDAALAQKAASRGVAAVDTIEQAVVDADVVFTMLPRGEHVKAVLTGPDGVLAHATADALIVDSSTISTHLARELHEAVRETGRRFLDAPVSGGVSGAVAGTLTYMVGGRADDLQSARPYLDILAARVVHAGKPGSGQAAKVVNNMMAGVNLVGMCEGAVLAQRLGLDPNVFHSIATMSSADSWMVRNWYPIKSVVETAGVNRDFVGGFSVALMHKDLGLAVDAGSETGTPLEFAMRARDAMAALIDAGLADRDCTVFVKVIDGSLPPPIADLASTSH